MTGSPADDRPYDDGPPDEGPPDERPGDWRTEADEEWLRRHQSANFERMRKRFRRLGGGVADALSHAELGPFGGAPRRPQLKIEGAKYSTVRYTSHRIAYTTIHVYLQRCRRCGRVVESHRVIYVREDGGRRVIGTLQVCRRCELNSWMFYSRMPSTTRARAWARKVVL
jgi:hypothetical protein